MTQELLRLAQQSAQPVVQPAPEAVSAPVVEASVVEAPVVLDAPTQVTHLLIMRFHDTLTNAFG